MALKRIARRVPQQPGRPHVVALPPHSEFIHPCRREEIELVLRNLPASLLAGLRAVVLLSGTHKQLRVWNSQLRCWGCYDRLAACIFLHAYPRGHWSNLDVLRDFYLKDVLLHEIGHHVDRHRKRDTKTAEGFANSFVFSMNKKA